MNRLPGLEYLQKNARSALALAVAVSLILIAMPALAASDLSAY